MDHNSLGELLDSIKNHQKEARKRQSQYAREAELAPNDLDKYKMTGRAEEISAHVLPALEDLHEQVEVLMAVHSE